MDKNTGDHQVLENFLDKEQVKNTLASNKNKKEKKKRRTILVLALLCVVAAIICLLLFLNQPKQQAVPAFAPNAQLGLMPGMTKEEIQKMLNEQIKENTVAFSINSNATMENGEAKCKLMLQSPPNNINYIEFVIRRDSNGDVLYKSGLLKPNQYILEDKLQIKSPLVKGTYPCTADITLYDRNSLKPKGMAQAALTVSVLH